MSHAHTDSCYGEIDGRLMCGQEPAMTFDGGDLRAILADLLDYADGYAGRPLQPDQRPSVDRWSATPRGQTLIDTLNALWQPAVARPDAMRTS